MSRAGAGGAGCSSRGGAAAGCPGRRQEGRCSRRHAREGDAGSVRRQGARAGEDAGLGLCAGFIRAWRPRVWQAGTHQAGTHP
jgi:hypothetical protein